MIFLFLRTRDVEEATLQKSMEGTAESSGGIGWQSPPRLSLTNATQVRLFNAASVRSEAFSRDEWDDWLSLGTNSRKLRFIVARRCLLPGYDTYRSLTHSTNPPFSFSTSPGCLQWDTNDNYTRYVIVVLRRERRLFKICLGLFCGELESRQRTFIVLEIRRKGKCSVSIHKF